MFEVLTMSPKISEEMNDALNNQIKIEFQGSYDYLSASFWLKELELLNLAEFFYKQAEEERSHGLKIAQYILGVGGSVKFNEMEKPKANFESIDELLEYALKKEEIISNEFFILMEMAEQRKEYNMKPLLDWFIKEQVEEEDTMRKLIQIRSYISNDFYFDHRIKRINE